MTNDTVNRILVLAAGLAILDSLLPKARYVWKALGWAYRKVKAIKIDEPPIMLNIPPPANEAVAKLLDGVEMIRKMRDTGVTPDHRTPEAGPVAAPRVEETSAQITKAFAAGLNPQKVLVRRITAGPNQLLAYELTKGNPPTKTYRVERRYRGESQSRSKETPNVDEANLQWHTWYKEWKASPGGFGGASGDYLDGSLPW